MGIHIYPLLRAEQCDEVYLQQTKVSTSVFAFSNPSAPHGPAHGRVHLSCAVYTFPAPKQVHLATPSHVWRRWGRGGLRGGAGWADGCADGPAASGVRPRGAGVSSCFSPPVRAVLPFVKLCGAPRPLAQIVEVGLADFSPQLQAVTQTHIHGSPFCTRRELRLATTHPRDTPSTLGRLLLLLLVLIHPHPHLHLHF